MREFPIYLRGRPLDFDIPIANLKHKTGLSMRQSIGLRSRVGELSSVFAERVNEEIGIVSGSGHPLGDALVTHETNHESVVERTTISCRGTASKKICLAAEPLHMEFRNTDINLAAVRYRTLAEIDDLTLADIDDMALEDLDYITLSE